MSWLNSGHALNVRLQISGGPQDTRIISFVEEDGRGVFVLHQLDTAGLDVLRDDIDRKSKAGKRMGQEWLLQRWQQRKSISSLRIVN